jgi:hypothetical protein
VTLDEAIVDLYRYPRLQYKEQMARYQRRLGSDPNDYAVRLQLDKMYVQLRRYPESIAVSDRGESRTRNAAYGQVISLIPKREK